MVGVYQPALLNNQRVSATAAVRMVFVIAIQLPPTLWVECEKGENSRDDMEWHEVELVHYRSCRNGNSCYM